MNGTALLKQPGACTADERQAFARLVREGFGPAPDDRSARIRAATLLAFHYATDNTLAAVAALKTPGTPYRDDVFTRARVTGAARYDLELGWVYTVPAHRGGRIGKRLCGSLLERVPATGVFATTHPDNIPMMRILHALGFERVGKPYARHDGRLALFLRPPRAS